MDYMFTLPFNFTLPFIFFNPTDATVIIVYVIITAINPLTTINDSTITFTTAIILHSYRPASQPAITNAISRGFHLFLSLTRSMSLPSYMPTSRPAYLPISTQCQHTYIPA